MSWRVVFGGPCRQVVGGEPVRYINLPIEELRKYAKAELDGGRAVWFGCDVGKYLHRKLGVMDLDVLDYDLVFGTTPHEMDKATRLRYGESLMTHAMVFTGYDAASARAGGVGKWRVENSWGDKDGDKGYYIMTDAWFDQYLYQIAVGKQQLSAEVAAVLEQEAVVLPPWDPMGSLARASRM